MSVFHQKLWINNVIVHQAWTLSECKSRGQCRTNEHVHRNREERSSRRQPRGVSSANASRDRNHRTTCRGSHPWNQPRLCLHRRLEVPSTSCTSLLMTTSWPARIRAYVVPRYLMCKDQTSLTPQRSYRVNLRRDIKDLGISGALLTAPRGTDSLSIRCLDT